jgi:hypothetical protein
MIWVIWEMMAWSNVEFGFILYIIVYLFVYQLVILMRTMNH